WTQTYSHLSSRVFAEESQCQGRSLERSAESHGGTGPASSQENQIVESQDGNPPGVGDCAVLGKRGPFRAICHAQARYFPYHAVHASVRLLAADAGDAAARRLGASCGWVGLATVGMGHLSRLSEYRFDACALSFI